eukprot:2521933-Amphidinium_carterae.1
MDRLNVLVLTSNYVIGTLLKWVALTFLFIAMLFGYAAGSSFKMQSTMLYAIVSWLFVFMFWGRGTGDRSSEEYIQLVELKLFTRGVFRRVVSKPIRPERT